MAERKVYSFQQKKQAPWKTKETSPSSAPKRSIVVTNLVTRLPKHTWRIDSRNMFIRKEAGRFVRKTKENFVTLMITIVGMATALTWNEVVKAVIDLFFADRSAIYVKIYVAVIATIFTLTVTYMISRMKDSGPK